jgi:hypothetical protein
MDCSKMICGVAVCLASALSSVSQASVFSAKIRPMQFNPEPADYSRGLDLSIIQPVRSMRGIHYSDVASVIPTDLDPNDQNGVGRRILNNTVNRAINSDSVRRSSLGRTAQSVQNSMQGGVSLGSREPNSVQHEIRVAADPMQVQARINYSGLTNAQLSYRAAESKVDFEWREPVAAIDTDLVYNHVNVPGDSRDLMSLRWSW